jgi:hypothetical protein
MTIDFLSPNLRLLTQEYVLIQAWKKTSRFIRYHNWYSDTLELDRTSANLPQFLSTLAEQLYAASKWDSDPLRIVPAPKSQQWSYSPSSDRWGPNKGTKCEEKLRPLAHVSIRDQVAATALMLCLADRIETIQGDPRSFIEDPEGRRRVLSYGNRLFCDAEGTQLHHRWGSAKLYRAYYQDYQTFIQRPGVVGERHAGKKGGRIVVIHTDLRQFYDRVRPRQLAQKLDSIVGPNDDPHFLALAKRLLSWGWSSKDLAEADRYAEQAKVDDFREIALPQGLVAAGFFSNLVLLDFDRALQDAFLREVVPGICLLDGCRYVDDLSLVLEVHCDHGLDSILYNVSEWLEGLLDKHAAGIHLSGSKTRISIISSDGRPLLRQSHRMKRIQAAISGGFDAVGGEEILAAIQGLVQSQDRFTEQRLSEKDWPLSPIPDVADETVARFAAGRYRTTYRSLRPLLSDDEGLSLREQVRLGNESDSRLGPFLNRSELDDVARAFALGLIEDWVHDPSNVRLLRIGLDLWPNEGLIKRVLGLLRPFTATTGRHKAPRWIALYCLAEIFRAGATETGIVESDESLPAGVDIDGYRNVLRDEALRLLSLPSKSMPWYLLQQILLFLAVVDPNQAPIIRARSRPETRHYRQLIRYLRGESKHLPNAQFATLAVLSRRSILGQGAAIQLTADALTLGRLKEICGRDPSFALELLKVRPEYTERLPLRVREDLCLEPIEADSEWSTLAHEVLTGGLCGRLRNEASLLQFADLLLGKLAESSEIEVITPSSVRLKILEDERTNPKIADLNILASKAAVQGSLYRCPSWCSPSDRWRYQLGYLLRFILSMRQDFTYGGRGWSWKEDASVYRAPDGHWFERTYEFYSGQSAFGNDWLPISDWIEQLLSALLHWPGRKTSKSMMWILRGIKEARQHIRERFLEISTMIESSGGLLILPVRAPLIGWPSHSRPLRACVVQTVIPSEKDFTLNGDPSCSDPEMRRRHRNHLSSALAAVERMLDLRETHKGREGRLDWLILPELAVHPLDVKTHLIPFARAHKAIILAGITYQELIAGDPLVNSALWVIPVYSKEYGLQVITRRQCKKYLAPKEEEALNGTREVIRGFRPCQWLIDYEWSVYPSDPPLRLSGSVCYDATDLALAAALRHYSDVFAVVALNRDVGTFDQMAQALHYHMYQMVIVANNGLYGGSNAYAPYSEQFARQIFHLHGQPQASIAFLEIEDIGEFLKRRSSALAQASSETPVHPEREWKTPPAGLR